FRPACSYPLLRPVIGIGERARCFSHRDPQYKTPAEERAARRPAEAGGAREVGGGCTVAHARRSLAGALDGYRSIGGLLHMKPVTMAAAFVLAVVSLAHLMRILFGVRVTVADSVIPMWVSGVAFVVAGGLAIMLWRSARTSG